MAETAGINFSARAIHAIEVPFSPLRQIFRTGEGVFDGIKAIFFSSQVARADESLDASRLILAKALQHLINVFRLKSFQEPGTVQTLTGKGKKAEFVLVNGFATSFVLDKITARAAKFGDSKSPWYHREITSRLTYTVSMVAMAVARVVEFAIGVVAAAASLITMGYSDKVSYYAFTGLQVTGVVKDFFSHLSRIIVPSRGAPNYGFKATKSHLD